jgi:hypothetical protein
MGMDAELRAPDGSIAEHLPGAPASAGLMWAAVSFSGSIFSVTALLWPISALESLVGLPHAAALGLWALVGTIASGLLTLVGARLVFGAWREVRVHSLLILLVGALTSAAQLVALAQWMIFRFGASAPEYVGLTFGLFALVAGVAVAGFAVQVAPREVRWLPVLAVVGGALLAVAIILLNLAGLADGLAPNSGPLAAATLASALYIGAVGVLSIARLRRGAP